MQNTDNKMWAYLIHVGYNMWLDKDAKHKLLGDGYVEDYCTASEILRFDKDVWDLVTGNMRESGINTLVIDLGEGIQYDTHPEIAVEGSLTKNEFSDMLSVLRQQGITPIPKLNFSTCHDEWLGKYARYVSTDEYYKVCNDLIKEVIELFDNPTLFHLGMDEETYGHQTKHSLAVIRNSELWWNDLFFFAKAVTDTGVRPWVWSDRIWNHEEEFLKRMPKEFLQSNWYYGDSFKRSDTYVRAYNILDENGYEHVPTGSNWSCQWNFEGTVNYCNQTCNQDQIKGYLQTVWRPTLRDVKYRHLEAVDIVRKVRSDIENK
jgi:hypothetical protein